MTSRALDLNFIRLIEAMDAVAWAYMVSASRMPYEPIDPTRKLALLPLVPFLVALFLLRREPNPSQWASIRVIHQALATVAFVVAAILLVGLPDTAIAFVFFTALALVQLAVLRLVRRFLPATYVYGRRHRVLRVGMVFLFAFGFLLLK